MISLLKKFLKQFPYLKCLLYRAQKSYSQDGEDLILARIFRHSQQGFYVDVGAHHPKRFSITYFFYKRNWHGINIDATPGSMKLFNKFRPKDINLELGVSDTKQTLTYYLFNEPALNTFSPKIAENHANQGVYKQIAQTKVETLSLQEILLKYLPKGQVIDFLTIDVEGFDLEVLKSNDWKLYRPKIILVEIINLKNIDEIQYRPEYQYLKDQGYEFFAKTYLTCIFKDTHCA